MDKTNDTGEEKLCRKKCPKFQAKQLDCYDWLNDLPESHSETQMVEVQFKNTRKGYYLNSNNIPLSKGDIVAVEATPGHDIGEVTLTGRLVLTQIKKNRIRFNNGEIKRVYRLAKPGDMEKYHEAKAREHSTMLKSRQIAENLNLDMKIGDVEYQGDGNKAIFYYIADERVDFRQLIRVLADTFKVRIEMKQIGARQEAGRIGGIGPCGRQLCCSSWMTNFVSVGTTAARFQDLSLNPQKLAGQCAKLKCCINYEADIYVEAGKRMPSKMIVLETKDNNYFHFKSETLKQEITYSTSKEFPANLVTISSKRAFEIIGMNKRGNKPISLSEDNGKKEESPKEFGDIIGQDSLTRFDKQKRKEAPKKKIHIGGTNPRERNQEANSENSKPREGDRPFDRKKFNRRKKGGGQNNDGKKEENA